jgi:hypothetical protein
MFGKRNRPPEPEPPRKPAAPEPPPQVSVNPPGGGGPVGPPSGEAKFPWPNGQSYVACNLAAGNLANNLASWVERDGRVHAETYVAASGAIAGYAAQQSLKELDATAHLRVATTASGDKYLFGDPLNDMLVAKTEAEANGRVWSRAASAAVSAGLPMARVPNWEDMFGHVAGSLGGPLEGRPSTGPSHQPAVPVRQLLALFWPHALSFFKGDFDELHKRFGPVPLKSWCAVAAYTTARPIIDVKDVLDPAIALTILMESAIYASKLTKF